MKTLFFSKHILQRLDPATRKQLRMTELVAFCVALYSGTIMGLGMVNLMGYPFLAGFIPMMVIVLLFEYSVLSSRSHGINWPRLVFGILNALVLAMILDTMLFNSDIENRFIEQQREIVAQIDSAYHLQQVAVGKRIQFYEMKNDSLEAILSDWNGKIYSEIDKGGPNRGPGKDSFARHWIALKRVDSLRFIPIFQYNDNAIIGLKNRSAQLEREKQDEIAQLISPENRGFSERLDVLKAMLIDGGNPLFQVTYIGLFLFGLCIELSVLYLKRRHHLEFDRYFAEQDRSAKNSSIENGLRSEARLQQIKQKIDMGNEAELAKDKLAHELRLQEELEQMQADYSERDLDHLTERVRKGRQRDNELEVTLGRDGLRQFKNKLNGDNNHS